MFIKSKFFRIAISLSLLLALCISVFADTIRLKDGSVVKGRVIGFKDGKFTVMIGEGSRERQMTFFADEVEKIDFEAPAVSIPTANTSTRVSTVDNPVNSNSNVPSVPKNTNSSTAGNPNIIVVGGNRNTSNQNSTNTNKVITPNSNNNSSGSSSRAKPIVVNVKVLADNTSNGWTNSGWVVKKGQRIKITGSGRISLGDNRFSTPDGLSTLNDASKLKKDEATGGLIVVIGDDNNDFIFIGSSREFVAQRDGVLFLGINEGNLNDNSGAFDVNIEIDPTISK
jgi:hypothetical protein